MKKIILAVLILTSSLAMAQSTEVVTGSVQPLQTERSCGCPLPKKTVAVKKLAPKVMPIPPTTVKAGILPQVGWPDSILLFMAGMILLLLLAVMFLIGRVTAPMQNPHVIAPVVYVQPLPPPVVPHP